jgi:hypothetical protein
MAIETVGDLITFALRTSGVNGVGQTPLAEDFTDALVLLRAMLAGWQRKRWLVPNEVDLAITSTGAASYTIGPIRPDRVHAAYVRLLGSNDNPPDIRLTVIDSYEDYAQITLKNLSTFPQAVFYDATWPDGLLKFWPIPPAGAYELHVLFTAPLPIYVNLTDELNLPPEYLEALIYSLAVRLAMNYGLDPRPAHVMAMRQAMNTLRMANTRVSQAMMPAGVGASGGSGSVAASGSTAFNSGLW